MIKSIPVLEHPKEVMQFTKAAVPSGIEDFFIMRHEDALPSNIRFAPPHKRQCFDITFISTDRYSRSVNESAENHSGDFITFVGPFQTHSYSLPEEQPTGFSVFFTHSFATIGYENTNFLNDFPFFRFLNHDVIRLSSDEKNFLMSFFEKMHYEYHEKDKIDFTLIRAYLNVLLLEVKKLYFKTEKAALASGRSNRIVDDFMMLLAHNSTRYNSLAKYADNLNVTPRYLSRTVKDSTGKTATFHIQQRIITEAKSLLWQTTLSTSEISYSLAFKDVSHFCRFFRQKTGISPQAYRLKR